MQNICKVCICFVIEFTIIASSFFCYGFLVLFYWWRKQNRHCDYWTQWNWINVFLGGHWDGIAERTSYIFGLSLNEGETIRETHKHTYTSESIDSLLLFCMFTKCAYIIYFNLQERIVNPNWNKCIRQLKQRIRNERWRHLIVTQLLHVNIVAVIFFFPSNSEIHFVYRDDSMVQSIFFNGIW